MGFMKFISKSLGLRSKKKRPQLERDSFDPPTSREFLEAATEETVTRLLRSSSARISLGPEELGLAPGTACPHSDLPGLNSQSSPLQRFAFRSLVLPLQTP